MNLWDPFEKLKADHAYKASKAKAVGPLFDSLNLNSWNETSL